MAKKSSKPRAKKAAPPEPNLMKALASLLGHEPSPLTLAEEEDALRRFAVRVRLLPTIDIVDVEDPARLDESNGIETYVEGYNAAILKMRKIFADCGFTV